MHEIKWWNKLWLFIKSKKLAIILIALLTVFSTIGMIIPQTTPNPGNYQAWAVRYRIIAPAVEALGLNNVFTSWWFALLGVIFFTNLTACTLQQIFQALKIWRRRTRSLQGEPTQVLTATGTEETVRKAVTGVFADAAYKQVNETGSGLLLEKHRWGIWGSVIFHAGLIAIVLGGLLSGAYKTTGYMMVAEGENRKETYDNYDVIYQGPLFKNEYHYGFDLTMKKQTRYYDDKGRLDYIKSDFVISENGSPVYSHTITKGEPLIYKDIRFFEYDDGFTPFFTLKKHDGSVVWQTYLLLNTHRYTDRRTYYSNNLQIPDTPFTISLEFYPDMLVKGGKVENRSSKLNNPAAKVIVSEKGKKIAEKIIKKGEPLTFSGYLLSFGDVRSWTGLEVVRDPGVSVLFGGFWLALAGLIILYLLNYRKVQVNFSDYDSSTEVKINYFTLRHRKHLSDEDVEIIEKIKNLLG